MKMVPVSTKVNNVNNEGRELIDPIEFSAQFDRAGPSGIERANQAGKKPSDSE